MRYRRHLAVSATLDLVRRHNDMINRGPITLEYFLRSLQRSVRDNRRWRPSGRWNNDDDFYIPTRRKLNGLAFAFPLSRNWRMFPIERPAGRRLYRFQSVTDGGVGTGHIEIESVQEDGNPALTREQLDERFLQELTAFEFSRGLCTLRPVAIELGRYLPEVHAYAMWGWRRDGTFCRQRIWMFSANGYQVRCRSVEFRDQLFVPELTALLASFRVK